MTPSRSRKSALRCAGAPINDALATETLRPWRVDSSRCRPASDLGNAGCLRGLRFRRRRLAIAHFLEVRAAALGRSLHVDLQDFLVARSVRGHQAVAEPIPVICPRIALD